MNIQLLLSHDFHTNCQAKLRPIAFLDTRRRVRTSAAYALFESLIEIPCQHTSRTREKHSPSVRPHHPSKWMNSETPKGHVPSDSPASGMALAPTLNFKLDPIPDATFGLRLPSVIVINLAPPFMLMDQGDGPQAQSGANECLPASLLKKYPEKRGIGCN